MAAILTIAAVGLCVHLIGQRIHANARAAHQEQLDRACVTSVPDSRDEAVKCGRADRARH